MYYKFDFLVGIDKSVAKIWTIQLTKLRNGHSNEHNLPYYFHLLNPQTPFGRAEPIF